MGFAKYHEDNAEMWEERNRDRRPQPVRTNPTAQKKTEQSHDKSACFRGQSTVRPKQNRHTVYLAVPNAT